MLKLLLFILFPVCSFGQTIDLDHDLLWEVSGKNMSKPSYVFGTFHTNDKRVFNLSDSTFLALNQAEVISIETDIFSLFEDWDTRAQKVQVKYDNQGDPYVSKDKATRTLYGNEDGMPQFLDAFFQQYCYNSEKQFVALESVDFQTSLVDEIDVNGINRFNLASMLISKDEMLDWYLKGDIYTLNEILQSSLSMYADGYKKLITNRNHEMVIKIDSILQSQSLFCAVGAGHLSGNEGIINLLRQKGYSVRKVTASYSDANPYKKNVFEARSYKYVNDTLGLNIIFPGRPSQLNQAYNTFDLGLIYRDFGQGNTYIVEVYPRTEDVGLEALAKEYIPSPKESPVKKIILDNGGEAYEGIADSYPEGLYWARVIMDESTFVVIKAYGGNKFMNSPRAQRFFENVWLD